MEQIPWQRYYPFGSRRLALTFPAASGSDIWLLERWLNRIRYLRPEWEGKLLPERGVLTGPVMLGLRLLAKRLFVLPLPQISEVTYSLFGQDLGQPSSGQVFGQRPLIVGDRGADVWVLQNRLVGSSRRLALILGRPADGVYDQRTARLVRTFQRENRSSLINMRVTGQVFSDTLLTIWDRTLLGGRDLSFGDRGLDVLALQELLAGLGQPVPRTGLFDCETAEHLASWQEKSGLPVSGSFRAIDCWQVGLQRGC